MMTDPVRSDASAADEISRQAAAAIQEHSTWVIRQARRTGGLLLASVVIAVSSLTVLRTSLPLWVPVLGIVATVLAIPAFVGLMAAAREDSAALRQRPLRSWTRPVTLHRRGGDVESWLLLYATGQSAHPAPFAAVQSVTEWSERTAYLAVDVAGFPRRGSMLTVFDAASGAVLAVGPVASTRKTVQLMRQD
jgi:hypothetical protein